MPLARRSILRALLQSPWLDTATVQCTTAQCAAQLTLSKQQRVFVNPSRGNHTYCMDKHGRYNPFAAVQHCVGCQLLSRRLTGYDGHNFSKPRSDTPQQNTALQRGQGRQLVVSGRAFI